METVTEVERILYKEDSERIKSYERDLRGRVAQTMRLLNKLSENYSFDSLEAIPQDIDSWILKMYLSRNKKARETYEWQPFRLSEINLPEDLTTLRGDLKEWSLWGHKEACSYLLGSKEGYVINDEMINREVALFAETQRVYLEGEQIVRLRICNDMLKGVEYERAKSGLDFNSAGLVVSILRGVLQRNPFLSYIGYKIDGTGNKFAVNENYVLTGKLTV